MTIATEIADLRTLEQEQVLLRSRLARLRRRLRLQMALEFALEAVALLVAAIALLVLLDWWLRLGLTARLVLLAAAVVTIMPFQVVRAIQRWRASRLDDLSLAMTLDRFRPGTGGRIADVLQLPAQLVEPSESVSPAMIHLAVKNATNDLAASDWSTLWNKGRTAWRGVGFVAALLVPTLFVALLPQVAKLSAARWLMGSNERWPQRTYLTVVGLDDRNRLLVPRDEPFAITVRADLPTVEPKNGRWLVPGRGEPLTLRSLPKPPAMPREVRLREKTPTGAVRDAVMVATGPAIFRHDLPPTSTPTTFDLTGGDDWLGPVKVERVARPALATTKFRAKEPGSPGNDFVDVEAGLQHPVFLPDTEVELTLVGTEPIASVSLTVSPGAPPKLVRVDSKSFTSRWTLHEATTLEIQLTSSETRLTSKPFFLSIGILKDREPRVTMRVLGVGGHVTPIATIPLSIAATDDRGLAAVRLQIERATAGDKEGESKVTKKTVPLPLATDAARAVLDHQARHDVELQAEPPAIGTILRLVAEAEDRCARGAQVGRSTAIQIQVINADELFYEILMRQRAERSKFINVLEDTEKRTPTLEGKPTGEAFALAMRGLNIGSRQLDLIAARIAETLQEMKLNQVGSPKSHRLLQEGVIEPIRALNNGSVSELRAVLQSLTGAAPKAGADPEAARGLHAVVVARMKTILDQMSQWESFVDVVNQVAEVIKMQQNVLQSAEKSRESRTQEIFDEKP